MTTKECAERLAREFMWQPEVRARIIRVWDTFDPYHVASSSGRTIEEYLVDRSNIAAAIIRFAREMNLEARYQTVFTGSNLKICVRGQMVGRCLQVLPGGKQVALESKKYKEYLKWKARIQSVKVIHSI